MSKLPYVAMALAVLSVPAFADTMSNAQMQRQMPANRSPSPTGISRTSMIRTTTRSAKSWTSWLTNLEE